MGLLDILSNPQMIGMAMAGLSRDPEAPMNAMKSLGMVEDINRRRDEEAIKERQRIGNAGLLKALMDADQSQGSAVADAFRQYGMAKIAPNMINKPPTPDNQTGTAVDYETGQSYNPPQNVPNPNKLAALEQFYNKVAALHQRPPIDLSQFQSADPSVILGVMKHQFENKPADQLMAMIDKAQPKPVIAPEGSSIYRQDPMTGELTTLHAGAAKDDKNKRALAILDEAKSDPTIIAKMTPEERAFYGFEGKESNNTENQWKHNYIEQRRNSDPNFAKLSTVAQEGAAADAYIKETGKNQQSKLNVVVAGAEARGASFANNRFYNMIDTQETSAQYPGGTPRMIQGKDIKSDLGRYIPAGESLEQVGAKARERSTGGSQAMSASAANYTYDREAPELIALRNKVYGKGLLPATPFKDLEAFNQWAASKASDPDVSLLKKKTIMISDALQRVMGQQGGEWAYKAAMDILDPTPAPAAYANIVKSHGVTLARTAYARQNPNQNKVQNPDLPISNNSSNSNPNRPAPVF